MKKVDGKVAFCIEHGVDLDMAGSGYNLNTYTSAKKERLSKIAYYGYTLNPTNHNYAITQMVIWEEFGDTLLTTPIITYQSEKKTILDKVAAHDRKPPFNGKQITLAVGDSITLTDTNGRLLPSPKLLARSPIRLQRLLTLVPPSFTRKVHNRRSSTSDYPTTVNLAYQSRSI